MGDLIKQESGAIEQFDPARYRLKQAALDYGIEEAKAIKDWPALERAIDVKISEQRLFVAWWRANVRRAGGDKRSNAATPANGLSEKDAERLTGMLHQRVSDLDARLSKDDYRAFLLGVEYAAACLTANEGRHTKLQGKFEWYTPEAIIEAARAVMGSIDLDPASSPMANKIVRAKKFYTEKEDGLTKTWNGNVFINPPFAHPTVENFANKLLASIEEDIDQAIWLSNACVDTKWWQNLARTGTTCFHLGRVKFYGSFGALQPPTMGQSIIYLGRRVSAFAKEFSKFGVVVCGVADAGQKQ